MANDSPLKAQGPRAVPEFFDGTWLHVTNRHVFHSELLDDAMMAVFTIEFALIHAAKRLHRLAGPLLPFQFR